MEPDRKRIVSAYTSSNRTIGEVAKLVGVGTKLVSRYLRAHGITQEDIRKRANSGKLAPEAKLKEAFNLFQTTEMLMTEIAAKTGVSENTIRKHLLNRGISEEQMRRRWLNNRRVAPDKRVQVVELYKSGDLTIIDVSKTTGISTPTIKKYLNNIVEVSI
jgi:transposase-like protein